MSRVADRLRAPRRGGSGPAWALAAAVLATAAGAPGAAWAQPTPQQLQDIQREQIRIQQQEQQRRDEQLRGLDPARRLPGTVTPNLPDAPALPAGAGACSQVTAIELEGAQRLTPAEREELTRPWIGRCMGLPEIGELMRAVTNRYVEMGLVTTRVYIPQQDLGQGRLRLLVLEGKVGELRLDDPSGRVNLGTAFPGVRGQVLNLRDIEQGLDQINRLRSNGATMELVPAQEPGLTDIAIRNQPGTPVSSSLTFDNYGSPSTGDIRATATLGLEGVLGFNEALFFSVSSNTDADRQWRLSESLLASANFPYGWWNITTSLSKSSYASRVVTATQVFRSSGETETYNLGVQRVLSRGQTSKLTLNTGLTHKISRNYIEGSLLGSSSPRLTDLQVGLTSVFAAADGFWTVDGAFSKGLKWFGVEPLPFANTGNVPTPTWRRWTGSVSYSRGLSVLGTNASWSSSLQGQTSPDNLYGSEQISIGGLYTVRGFDGTSISGERGLYWRNELAFVGPPSEDARAARWFGRLQPYIATDVGRVYGRNGQLSGTLAGLVVGLRSIGGQFSFDLGWGQPVHVSPSIKARGDVENRAVYLRAGISF
jgi:hemolysin activation/secretion protein